MGIAISSGKKRPAATTDDAGADEIRRGELAEEMYEAAAAVIERFDMVDLMAAVEALQEGAPWPEAAEPARRFFLALEREMLEGKG